ncbi:hypothetical protein CMK11_01855 [Candidatus Poribacteria bacterium]|nr:hypothetical protein [Candidatus Poribacteria bacterium]
MASMPTAPRVLGVVLSTSTPVTRHVTPHARSQDHVRIRMATDDGAMWSRRPRRYLDHRSMLARREW